ncbi:type I secretion system permease/ATPase [Bosea sp. F3-2]|uniref:type I secretion system permease/ATPase n=1 Tax=Bosea sp. F3-2 TaxID=2599640 RepID=UPI0011F0518C|nr:type I secretion system permease/ATPase [Bosea sp. F3-2]QEL26425.1 type I secretion system permease/ATPase [Bosea sp. F3-2]
MSGTPKSDELNTAFAACRRYFVTAALFSLAINILYLASPLYMLQVYDRVINSRSEVTLVMLTVVLVLALAALALLDMVRARILSRAGVRLDSLLAGRIVSATFDGTLRRGPARYPPLRDFDTFRQFVTGPGIHAVFDLPWAPIYIFVIFLLHPYLGLFALGCAIVLVGTTLANEWLVRQPTTDASEAASRSYNFTEASLRNAEVVQAMGMLPGLLRRWRRDRNRMIDRQQVASDRSSAASSLIRFLRLAMQSLILGVGAYLVIERLTTSGAMFAASIMLGRALQPVEQLVGSWRSLISARGAYDRIRTVLSSSPPAEESLNLPRPEGHLALEAVSFALPGASRPLLRGITFHLEAGKVLGVVGPSGAGKSTLARLIIGVTTPSVGVVRLDGADVSAWPRASLGLHLGYLPQDIELFADTVAANISRFRREEDIQIIEAAKLAGVHEIILRLPKGYDTNVGEGGAVLSGGVRQRIALARAVYGNPSLVLLDEPSSNLDADGDAALLACITELKNRGTTVVMVTHRPNTLTVVDSLLVLKDGMIEVMGPRHEVMARVVRPVRPAALLNVGELGA